PEGSVLRPPERHIAGDAGAVTDVRAYSPLDPPAKQLHLLDVSREADAVLEALDAVFGELRGVHVIGMDTLASGVRAGPPEIAARAAAEVRHQPALGGDEESELHRVRNRVDE